VLVACTPQVKDCVAAARQGIEYQPRKITGGAADATTSTDGSGSGSSSGSEGDKLHVSGSGSEGVTSKRKLTDGEVGGWVGGGWGWGCTYCCGWAWLSLHL
jgi:hypothetical protein